MDEAGMRRGWVPYAWIAAAFLVMASVGHFAARQSGGLTPVSERKVMPDIVMAQLDGGTWRMTEHRSQVVLVNYWATWCGPCREEMPGLVRLSRDLGPKGLAVVGIAMDDGGEEKVRRFVEEMRVNYPIVIGDEGLGKQYGLGGMPLSVLVDRQGKIADEHAGVVNKADTEKKIRALLDENPKRPSI